MLVLAWLGEETLNTIFIVMQGNYLKQYIYTFCLSMNKCTFHKLFKDHVMLLVKFMLHPVLYLDVYKYYKKLTCPLLHFYWTPPQSVCIFSPDSEIFSPDESLSLLYLNQKVQPLGQEMFSLQKIPFGAFGQGLKYGWFEVNKRYIKVQCIQKVPLCPRFSKGIIRYLKVQGKQKVTLRSLVSKRYLKVQGFQKVP